MESCWIGRKRTCLLKCVRRRDVGILSLLLGSESYILVVSYLDVAHVRLVLTGQG